LRYLKKRQPGDDMAASVSAELGFLFCIIATVSGSIFAKATWGSYWNWDPRETSIFVLLLIYGAYFALRASVDEPERRGSLSAVYALLAFVTVPILVFVVPRIPAVQSLPPQRVGGQHRRGIHNGRPDVDGAPCLAGRVHRSAGMGFQSTDASCPPARHDSTTQGGLRL